MAAQRALQHERRHHGSVGLVDREIGEKTCSQIASVHLHQPHAGAATADNLGFCRVVALMAQQKRVRQVEGISRVVPIKLVAGLPAHVEISRPERHEGVRSLSDVRRARYRIAHKSRIRPRRDLAGRRARCAAPSSRRFRQRFECARVPAIPWGLSVAAMSLECRVPRGVVDGRATDVHAHGPGISHGRRRAGNLARQRSHRPDTEALRPSFPLLTRNGIEDVLNGLPIGFLTGPAKRLLTTLDPDARRVSPKAR